MVQMGARLFRGLGRDLDFGGGGLGGMPAVWLSGESSIAAASPGARPSVLPYRRGGQTV